MSLVRNAEMIVSAVDKQPLWTILKTYITGGTGVVPATAICHATTLL